MRIKKTKLTPLNLCSIVMLLLLAFSCNEDVIKKTEAIITEKTIEDGPIKDDILSRVQGSPTFGRNKNKNAIAVPTPPGLPSGYDYANSVQMNVSTVPYTIYAAYKLTGGNTSLYKEAILLYYDGSVYKGNLKMIWQKGLGNYNHLSFATQENNYINFKKFRMIADGTSNDHVEWETSNVSGTASRCVQNVLECVVDFYTGWGWQSVGIALTTINTNGIYGGFIVYLCVRTGC